MLVIYNILDVVILPDNGENIPIDNEDLVKFDNIFAISILVVFLIVVSFVIMRKIKKGA